MHFYFYFRDELSGLSTGGAPRVVGIVGTACIQTSIVCIQCIFTFCAVFTFVRVPYLHFDVSSPIETRYSNSSSTPIHQTFLWSYYRVANSPGMTHSLRNFMFFFSPVSRPYIWREGISPQNVLIYFVLQDKRKQNINSRNLMF